MFLTKRIKISTLNLIQYSHYPYVSEAFLCSDLIFASRFRFTYIVFLGDRIRFAFASILSKKRWQFVPKITTLSDTYRGKNFGVLISRKKFRRGNISSPRGIFITFPRLKFQIRHFPPTKFTI